MAVDSGWCALEFLELDDEKASVKFDRLDVDVIITDYCIPGMTGYELLKKIKESTSFREVPVVIMSSENVINRIRCLEEGAEDFLLKPVKLADVKRLRNYLTRDVILSDGNKRNLPKDDINFSSPASSLLPPPPSSTSMEATVSIRPSSPMEFISSSSPSPIVDDDSLATLQKSSTSPVESPIKRVK